MADKTQIHRLAEFIVDFKLKKAPAEVADAAVWRVIDTVGAAVGAQLSSAAEIYKKSRQYFGGGPCTVWGASGGTAAIPAAMYNAMMSHCLELDDVHAASKTHIGTVAVPAAWAMSEHLGKSGTEFLEAVVCAYETEARIGMAVGVKRHRQLGWHATGTMGTFGAAAAGARLLGLEEDETVYALGLAGTQSAGLWSFLAEGANTKILHAGNAARCGLTAAVMAAGGVRGAEHVLDAEDGGLFRAMSGEYDLDLVSDGLGSVYEILNVENKPYPCCRSTHSAIDAALKVRGEIEIHENEIDSIEINTYLVGYQQCGSTEKSKCPKTATEAKFSTAYCVSCALLYGAVEEKYFHPPYLGDGRLIRLCGKISVRPDRQFTEEYPRHWGAELILKERNGKIRSVRINDPFGSRNNPIGIEGLLRKITPMFAQRYGELAPELINSLMELKAAEKLPKL